MNHRRKNHFSHKHGKKDVVHWKQFMITWFPEMAAN